MCTQTFFQLFIFSNNQKKMENKSLIVTGRPVRRPAHGRFWPGQKGVAAAAACG
jgi:hypothetical protein